MVVQGRKGLLLLTIAVVIAGVGYLTFGNFGKNLVYFFTPSEVLALSPEYYGRTVRVGGMVVPGSVQVIPNTLRITFGLTDGVATIPVQFEGIRPDLFNEGQGAVVEGRWDATQVFHSTMILAKHSEDYMPIEMKQAGVEFPKKDLFKTLRP